jgi:SNF2 family DNA or RNA helicase
MAAFSYKTRLNLTAASRAYLMEPQWNPSIEEQALARIHRLGQTRKVETIRFVVKDSIEDVRAYLSLFEMNTDQV